MHEKTAERLLGGLYLRRCKHIKNFRCAGFFEFKGNFRSGKNSIPLAELVEFFIYVVRFLK